jgi:hypothetical protein
LLSFVSPLCNLSVALFSARVSQHMVIVLLAAPLIARGLVFAPPARRPWTGSAWMAVVGFAAIFWIWHSPAFYDETLRSNVVYWLMHATTVAAALVLWIAVFNSSGPLAFLVLRERRAGVAARRSADLRRRSSVFGARVHHRGVGPDVASGSTAWRPCDVGARRIAADRLFGSRICLCAASGPARPLASGRKTGLGAFRVWRTVCGLGCSFSR